jgi:hypothetical protein
MRAVEEKEKRDLTTYDTWTSTKRREHCRIAYKMLYTLGIYPSFWIEIISIVSPQCRIALDQERAIEYGSCWWHI